MGNVSYLVPSIHPMIKVAPDGVPIHTPDFAGFAITEAADRAVLDGAKAMAMTVVDLWAGEGLLDAARAEHRAATAGVARPHLTSGLTACSGAIPGDRGGAALV